ncbi:hypothetical protein D9M68_822190 [compost metagenome]|uniref:hypothetical protein n=1 Tax=Ensifer sp. 22521 TaxID=3453935 RepID=UPI0028B65055
MQYNPRVYIEIISYSIYLWHYPMSRIRYDLRPPSSLLAVAIPPIAMAALSYEFVKKPLRAMQCAFSAAVGCSSLRASILSVHSM